MRIGPPGRRAPLAALVVVCAASAACSHGEPYGVPPYGSDQPFAPGAPTRLTYSALSSSGPSWLPDGSELLYTALRIDFPDTTGCLELLPPDGGQATRSICPELPVPLDSTRALQAGAVSPGGQLAYLRSARSRIDLGWKSRQLIVTRLDPHAARRVVLTLPFTSPLSPYSGLSQIRWLDENRFVYRADLYTVAFLCPHCPPVDESTGLFIAAVDLRTDPATFTAVPGTNGATSVAVADSDTIVFTLSGDSTVHREALSSGATSVLKAFAGGATSAVQLAGTRLAALVNGRIQVVDLAAGTTTSVDTLAYEELALSPDGKRLVAARAGDLWLLGLP
ncbi:MAG: hypothetical protein ACHQX4_06820 [Gemmatimonadales bacterium]